MDGSFYRASTEKACKWSCVSGDQTRAFSVLVAKQVRANAGYEKVQVKGLVPGKQYHFYNLPGQVDVMQFGSLINAVSPVHLKQNSMMHKLVAGFVKIEREQEDYLLSGEELAKVGVLLHPAYGGTGFNDQTRVFRDYASRMYYIEQA